MIINGTRVAVACGSTTGNFLVRGQLLHFIRVEKAGMPDESIVPMLVSRTCGSVSILRFCHEWGKRTICSKNIRGAIEEIVVGKSGKSICMMVDVCKNKFGHLGQHSDTREGKGRCTPEQPSRFQKLKTGMAAPAAPAAPVDRNPSRSRIPVCVERLSSSAPSVRKPGITWLSQVLKKRESKKRYGLA